MEYVTIISKYVDSIYVMKYLLESLLLENNLWASELAQLIKLLIPNPGQSMDLHGEKKNQDSSCGTLISMRKPSHSKQNRK